ncbi:MAG: hypothetical protein ACD_48C00689G0003 [uncultured bacterium]|nr:MAG: hypothetical protein ACD_48C00689G0003 [uncultured bacterium]
MKKILNNYTRGITLIELVVTIGIIVIIGTALAIFMVDNFKFHRMAMEEGSSMGEAQKIVDNMKKEIRSATESENGSFPIESAGNQTLVFYSDYDKDEIAERIRYQLSGQNLERGTIEPTSGETPEYLPENEQTVLINTHVVNEAVPIFYYYDENYTGTQSPMNPIVELDIRVIGIHLIVDTAPATSAGRYILDTEVRPRNL